MPKKPQKNQPKTGSEKTSDDSSHSDFDDAIDDLELEPISSQLPRTTTTESIPPKPSSANSDELTDAQIDDISLDSIDRDETSDSKVKTDNSEPAQENRKPTRRMYPSGREVDLTNKTEENPAPAESAVNKKQPPISITKPADKLLDEDIEEIINDDPALIPGDVEDLVKETYDSGPDEPTEERSRGTETRNKDKLSTIEKGALGLLFLLLIVGLVVYIPQMIPEGQTSNVIVDKAETPIEMDDLTIDALEVRWTETLHIASRVRRNVKWTPEVEIAISGAGSGALRFIFLDQDGRQRGDTIDIAYENGQFPSSTPSNAKVYCTHGFTSELELKDLRARGNAWWTVRVLKGQNIKAASSEFIPIIEMKIPFEIVVSKN